MYGRDEEEQTVRPSPLRRESSRVFTEIRPLTSADLLAGIANVPVRVIDESWVENEGEPDSLWVALSNGRNFTLVLIQGGGGLVDVYEGEALIQFHTTGLTPKDFFLLQNKVWGRFCEDMAGVEVES